MNKTQSMKELTINKIVMTCNHKRTETTEENIVEKFNGTNASLLVNWGEVIASDRDDQKMDWIGLNKSSRAFVYVNYFVYAGLLNGFKMP